MKRGAIKAADAKLAGKSAIAAPAVAEAEPESPRTEDRPKRRTSSCHARLSMLASLRLTVILMSLSLFLVFAGTLAQIDAGIWSVVGQYFSSYWVWIPFQLFVKFGQIFFWFCVPQGWKIPGSFPFPGGFAIGIALGINLLAAHAVRFKLSWKRSGIIMIHAGILVMLAGEFITREFAVEGNMSIENQNSSNYLESRQKIELAIVNTSNPKEDYVVVIPGPMLKPGSVLNHDALPFDVVVDRYYPNSGLVSDKGKLEPQEKPVNSGVDSSSETDMPAVYVTLRKKGSDEKIASLMTSLWFTDWVYRREAEAMKKITPDNKPSHVLEFDGDTYDVALRWQRMYKPYTISLEEFKHELYPGTDMPKNFSSKIQLANPEQNEERRTLIKMNSPMRYNGETFYQSSWLRTSLQPGDQGTILQVVRNPGWILPYLSCTMVTLGMLIHFGMYLIKYLNRRAVA